MKDGDSIKYIMERINDSMNKLYKPKGWNENDIDLATLLLRLVCPSLIYSFNNNNKFPSTSFIYITLANKI